MPMPTEKQLEKRALKAQDARRRAQERAQRSHVLHGDALDALNVAVSEEETAFKELCAFRQAALSPPARDETLCVPEDEE
jgi:hypothetical protein